MLSKIIEKFKGKRIAVVGDFCVDHIIKGKMIKISEEAPAPVLEQDVEIIAPGGAGNTAANVYSMGALVYPFTFVGNDKYSDFIKQYFKGKGNIQGLIFNQSRKTHCYNKFYGEGFHGVEQQLWRVDTKKQPFINHEDSHQLLDVLEKNINKIEGIIIADYEKGNITEELVNSIAEISNKYNKLCIGDSRRRTRMFKNLTAIKPNDYEALFAAYQIPKELFDPEDKQKIIEAGKTLLNDLNNRYVISTRGEYGMITFERNNDIHITEIPTKRIEVADITGAGDTTCAALILALVSGATIQEAARIGNAAGGIAVSRKGTVTVSLEDLANVVNQY